MRKAFIIQIAIVFGILFVVGLLVSTSPVLAQGKSTWQAIKERGSFRLGATPSPPWFYKDPKTRQWSGFSYLLAKEIAHTMGVKLEIVETTWGNMIAALHADQIDLSIALDATPKRALAIDFIFHPLLYVSLAILAREDLEVEYWEDLNKPSIKLAVPMGTSNDRAATALLPKAKITRYPSNDETVASFQSRRSDGVCLWLPPIISYRHKIGMGKIVLPKPIQSIASSIGVRREPDKTWRDYLNIFVAFYYRTGRMQKLWDKNLRDHGIDPKIVPPIIKELWD